MRPGYLIGICIAKQHPKQGGNVWVQYGSRLYEVAPTSLHRAVGSESGQPGEATLRELELAQECSKNHHYLPLFE